ncbi:hypothetical protein SAMN04487792_0862 [Lactobacillus bombicola]|uniref:Uncharacterized protein n=1 Tax=Lactobacillus bombicola TaxID=1505723 RepID=A0A1I1SD51_9LACO|nr:hypothetical protein [Lactobacillus bombicola]SFD44406.1 hypothetical protein SAMN04487792_0862 [Lactobacillus bombicola]
MRLTDLLQLTADLNQQTKLFFSIDNQVYPLTQLKITSSAGLLYPGKLPMTKAKVIYLVKNLYGLSIPLYVLLNEQKFTLYGVQIVPEKNAIYLQ